jgi:hypothetical protein
VKRVPVEELVDMVALSREGAAPSPRALREALPRGWVLEADGRTARADLRVMAREGWVLVFALVSFGAIALGLFWSTFPRGAGSWLRLLILLAVVLLAGGWVAPLVTRALYRKAAAGDERRESAKDG